MPLNILLPQNPFAAPVVVRSAALAAVADKQVVVVAGTFVVVAVAEAVAAVQPLSEALLVSVALPQAEAVVHLEPLPLRNYYKKRCLL